MRATPGLIGGAGIAAGLMYLLDRQPGKRRRSGLAAAALAAAANLPEAARRLRPRWRNGRITMSRPHRMTFPADHPWAVTGAAASVLAAGMWKLGHRHPRQIRMATTIDAPTERVFDAWSRFEDFPRFMPMVAHVRPVGDNRWQWTISKPGGASIDFISRITLRDRPQLIAWATDDGAVTQQSGTVRFRPTAKSKTRVEIEIVRGASDDGVGEGVAVTAGADLKRALRHGLAAFKAHVEKTADQGV